MILHGSLRSPYVRKCRIVALENEIDLPLDIHSVLDPETPPPSPLLRIPSLQMDDGRLLIDSRVICDYLNGMNTRTLEDRHLEAVADGIMDRSVSRFLMVREDRQYHNRAQLERWESAIRKTLDMLNADVPPKEPFEIGQISLICALGYLDSRHADLNWRENRSALTDWFSDLSSRPSIRETEPPQ